MPNRLTRILEVTYGLLTLHEKRAGEDFEP